jgi:hypothetical protein
MELMTEHRENLKTSIIQLLIWSAAAPILSVWFLVSFLPMISLLRAWGDLAGVAVALAFLISGALGLIAATAGYRWLLWAKKRPIVSRQVRTRRVVALSVYALVWMTLYALSL